MCSNLYKLAWFLRARFYSIFFGKIGINTYIGKVLFLHKPNSIFIGNKVRIFPGARFECHNEGKIIIEDNVSIGQNLHLTAMGKLILKEGCTLSAAVMITDIDHQYDKINIPISEQGLIYKKTEIGKNCFIGMGARIQGGTILGDGCIVGTNAVVRGHFLANSVIVGVPGRVIKTYDHDINAWNDIR